MNKFPLDIALIEFDGSNKSLHRELKRLTRERPGRLRPEDHPFWSSIECHQDLTRMMSILNQLAPPKYYFGPSDYDPFSIGYWRIT